MADDNTTPTDKAAAAAGATSTDQSESTSGSGAPAPAEPPKNKAEAEAREKLKEGETPEGEEEETPEGEETPEEDGEETPPEDEDKPLDTETWGSTGDEVGDSVLELIQNAGMSTDEAKSLMYDAVQAGDITKIDVAALEAKVGKAKANLIMAGTRDYISRSTAKAETITKEVHTTVGGKENWDAVTTWAKANIPANELTEYGELIDMGGAKARFAAQELASRFNGDGNNTTLNAGDGELTPDTSAQTSAKATTRAQYVEAMKAAHDRGATDAEIQAIKADRARGRAKGI